MTAKISRRAAVGLLGASAAAGTWVADKVNEAATASADAAFAGEASALRVGERFGRWTVRSVSGVRDGALSVGVAGADGHAFVLEILARDASPLAPRPPASTDALAIFVRNGGDGWSPTIEDQGLAAMTLASALTARGLGGPVAGLLTHAERVARHRDTLIGAAASAQRRARCAESAEWVLAPDVKEEPG
jgi:hypothetical protein